MNVEQRIAEIERAGKIWCPSCGAEYIDEESRCISYHGDNTVEIACGHCEKPFMVVEHVRRTYETHP